MAEYVSSGGEFNRDTDYITTRITADGRDGYPGRTRPLPAVVARACPWANRAIIVRRLLGLEDVLSIGFCGPTHDERSWTFDLDPGGVDPVLKIPRLQDAYFARFPDYPKGITVPAIVDVPTGQVVTNDFAQMTLDLSTEWTAYHRDGAPELYPEPLRAEIDEVAKRIYTEVNNGVYRCGFAGSQEAYEKAYDRLFTALDWLNERLENQRFLVGDTITEADVRLFTTLARFDPVYHGHFKCQPLQARRDARAVGVCARPVPDPGLRRHHRLRSDQAALLHRAHRHQPDPDRAEGPGPVELADTARPGSVGRQAVRRRLTAGTDAGGRARTRRARSGLGPGGAHRPLGVRPRELVARLVAHERRQLHREAEQPAAVRIHRGDRDRQRAARPEFVDDVGAFVGPHQHPRRTGNRRRHRQLHRRCARRRPIRRHCAGFRIRWG